MAKGKINVAVENIFPLIKKFLYSDHEIFLRELMSNATDATFCPQSRMILSSRGNTAKSGAGGGFGILKNPS